MGIGCMHSLGARVGSEVLESLESKVERLESKMESKVEDDRKKVREYIDNKIVHMPKA